MTVTSQNSHPWVAEYVTGFGAGWIAGEGSRLNAMGLPGRPLPEAARAEVSRLAPAHADLLGRLEGYWRGGPLPRPEVEMIVAAAATPFQEAVYRVVAAIPRGATMTYGDVAEAAGRPGAARAVGAAMARNPFAPVIPCHRVVGSDGSLRGYGGGPAMKQALLDMESSRG